MRCISFVVLILFSAVHTAQAGAWLREKGTGFASFSYGATQSEQTNYALYLEYGLNDKTTIGVDINAASVQSDFSNAFANAFYRRSIGSTDNPSKWAYEVGLGAVWQNDRILPTVKTAVSWGRGFQLGARGGWVNVDASYTLEPTLMTQTVKLDATTGLDFTAVTTGILEFTMSRQDTSNFTAIEPSLLIKPKRTAFQVKVGAQIPLDEDDGSAIKFGIWRNF